MRITRFSSARFAYKSPPVGVFSPTSRRWKSFWSSLAKCHFDAWRAQAVLREVGGALFHDALNLECAQIAGYGANDSGVGICLVRFDELPVLADPLHSGRRRQGS